MKTLDEIYTREWFENDFAGLQPEFDIVADGIYRQFKPFCAIDVGCGPGMVVRRLRDHTNAYGIDGARAGIDYANELDPRLDVAICQADITEPDLELPDFVGNFDIDLVICTEVAEHLDEKDAPHLVKLLCSAMCPIVFTAAPPGQDGHHHVNCQYMSWWEELFNMHGATRDVEATHQLSRRWVRLNRLKHMRSNMTVFS